MEKNLSIGEYATWYARPVVHMYLYFFVGFLTPFSLGHPQLLVGTVVNAVLILSAMEFGLRKTAPLLFAPSLGVLARGLVFGPFTPFLIIMLPFIWIGNALLVFAISKNQKSNYWINLGSAAAAKTGVLFSAAFVLVSLSALPPLFMATMGLDQLITALAGGAIAIGLHKSNAVKKIKF